MPLASLTTLHACIFWLHLRHPAPIIIIIVPYHLHHPHPIRSCAYTIAVVSSLPLAPVPVRRTLQLDFFFWTASIRTEPNPKLCICSIASFIFCGRAILSYPSPIHPIVAPSARLHHPSSTFQSSAPPSSIIHPASSPVHSPPLLAALRCHAFISLSSSYSPARNLRLPLAPSPLPARFLSRIITYDALPPSLKRAAACRWGARRADSRIRISRRQKKEQTSPLRRPKAGCCINLVWLLYIQLYCSARACVRVTYLAYILACCTAARRRVLVVDALNFLK